MKKVKSRILKIRNFKNIGLSKKDNEYQELYLDSYLDDKIVGNLIILIGENNIGKSNVLKSINMIQDTKDWEKNKNSSDIDNDEFQKELSNILENNRPNSPDYNDNSLIELIDEKEYSYSVNFENEKYEVKIEPNPNKIYDTKNIEKIKKLLEKYYNLSEDELLYKGLKEKAQKGPLLPKEQERLEKYERVLTTDVGKQYQKDAKAQNLLTLQAEFNALDTKVKQGKSLSTEEKGTYSILKESLNSEESK
ncbi:AAA family ATPase, partial [Brachyspira sp.]|uniref:AAA family ATPase n=1 Tax=Brachyspira sp. TaxID=1977261 RepID=UPI003D7EE4EA